ncbi:MAG: hypothetical protein WCI05_01115 [Myxococcales bacterium]
MAYELAALHSYVRFYQAVVAQLDGISQNLTRTQRGIQEALAPFVEPLAPVHCDVLSRSPSPAVLAELWRPEDRDGLTGLRDVYEVVGRFSFQGEGNANLAQVRTVVEQAKAATVVERERLKALRGLANDAKRVAGELRQKEQAAAEQRRRELEAGFEERAETVRARAKQTLDVVQGQPVPELLLADTAAEEYRKYITKVNDVYRTCLPFLRKALTNLYAFVGAEVQATWPETLSLAKELPQEFVKSSFGEPSELQQARATLRALDEEKLALARADDEAKGTLARIGTELEAVHSRGADLDTELASARAVLDYVTAEEQVRALGESIEALHGKKAERVRTAGEIWQRQKQADGAGALLNEEIARRTEELGELQRRLEAEKGDEPVLFGKEEWRTKVASIDARVVELTEVLGQRRNGFNQLRMELAAIAVQLQTEQAQMALVDRAIQEAHGKREAMERAVVEMGQRLGGLRPSRPMRLPQAEQMLLAVTQRRAELAERIERFRMEQRRCKDEGGRIQARTKQIDAERLHAQATLDSTAVAEQQGREAGLRQLAVQRRSAVVQHVDEVLGPLKQSLSSVDVIFVEPAREAMVRGTEASHVVSDGVREHGERVGPVVDKLAGELEPELLGQEAALEQIGKEFCDKAEAACRAAWG